MTVTKLEKWIAPRAVSLLAVISVLIVGSGVALYFVREQDLQRVSRLERIVRCQDNKECREFIERAIRETLKDKGVKVDKKHGVSLRVEDQDGMPYGVIAIGAVPSPVPPASPETAIGPSKGLGDPGGTRTPKHASLPRTEPPSPSEGVANARPVVAGGPPSVDIVVPPTDPAVCVSVGGLVETC